MHYHILIFSYYIVLYRGRRFQMQPTNLEIIYFTSVACSETALKFLCSAPVWSITPALKSLFQNTFRNFKSQLAHKIVPYLVVGKARWLFSNFHQCFDLIKIKQRFFRCVNAVTGPIVCALLWAHQGSEVSGWSVVWTAWWSWGERRACCSHSRSARSWPGPWGSCWEMGSTHQIANTRTDCRNMGVLEWWCGKNKGMTEFSVCVSLDGRMLQQIFLAQVTSG